jgi:hypothetical protein
MDLLFAQARERRFEGRGARVAAHNVDCTMLCEFAPSSFVTTWALLTAIGFSIVMISSSIVFFHYYWKSRVTFGEPK